MQFTGHCRAGATVSLFIFRLFAHLAGRRSIAECRKVVPLPPPPKHLIFMRIRGIRAEPLITKGLRVKILRNKELGGVLRRVRGYLGEKWQVSHPYFPYNPYFPYSEPGMGQRSSGNGLLSGCRLFGIGRQLSRSSARRIGRRGEPR